MPSPDPGHRLLLLALERGLINEEDLAQALRHSGLSAASAWGDEVETLVRRGVLEPSQVVRLAQELRHREPGASHPPDSTLLEAAAELRQATASLIDPLLDIALDPEVVAWDRYQLGDMLGQGGMGCVYRAHDRKLDREVALKFLRRDDPDQVQRFRREARAQAQIDHENVCRVYEVGEISRHSYIAMQYVEGQSLVEAGLQMTLTEKVAIAAKVARAVHAAHERGLVHRDLKPANIMVEHRERGWHPFVLDFGIARTQREAEVTEPGTVLGTLSYISPEQARGAVEELDHRSDVYGLGATFYALLAGCPPFAQSVGPEIVWRIVHEEPWPLRRRNPEIPRDLDTIVMKCLAKDPARRYQTAGELADDLERFLLGQPIRARPTTLGYRLGKALRRHVALAAVVAAALLVITLALAANLRTAERSRVRAALTHRLAQEVKEMESAARVSAMMPLHDRSGERQRLLDQLAHIEASSAGYGSLASGPVHHALGRGHLLLGDPTLALEHLLAAWQQGFTESADAFALGRAYGALYQQGQAELLQVASPEQRGSRQQELERRFREPALRYLRLAGDVQGESPAYVEGLIAFYAGQLELAQAKAAEAFAQAGWLYEAKRLEGEILLALAQQRLDGGTYRSAAATLDDAGQAFAAALAIARSDASIYEGECLRWIKAMELERATGVEGEAAFGRSLAACSGALSINPTSVVAFTQLSHAHWRRAEQLRLRGGDPKGELERAAESARRALALDNDSLQAHYNLGCALRIAAERELERGGDALPLLEEAAASLRRAIAISPAFAPAHDDLGYALEYRGRYESAHGIDPSASLEGAIASYREAIRLSGAYPNSHNNLGIALLRRGSHLARVGGDPSPSFDEALASFARAVDLNPNYAYAHANVGYVHHARARDLLERGKNPSVELEAARAAFARAEAVNRAIPWSYPELAAVELDAARWASRSGADPEPALRRAQAAVDRALALNPRSPQAFQRAAELELERARGAVANRRPPQQHVERGLRLVARCLELKADAAEPLLVKAGLLLERARVETAAARRRTAGEAADALQRALAVNRFLALDCAPLERQAAALQAE